MFGCMTRKIKNKSASMWNNVPPGSGTNRNGDLDLLAPGVNINSTTLLGDYTNRTGTSYSTPHVSGPDCLSNTCYQISYNGITLRFNTTSFSSFAASNL